MKRTLPRLALLIALPALAQAAAPPRAYAPVKGFSTTATALAARPAKAGKAVIPAYLGVQLAGAAIESIDDDSPAARAGLRAGDVLASADGLRRALAEKKPGDRLEIRFTRAGKPMKTQATLAAVSSPLSGEPPMKGFERPRRGGRGGRWTGAAYRLAVILVEYPDTRPNQAITPEAWEDSLFSTGTYTRTSATGQRVFGSMNDHFREQSYGKLRITGKAFPYVKVSKKRADYGKAGTSRQALLTEALDLALARDGKDALKGYDGVFFIYAGGRMQMARGSLYWPHRASVRHAGRSWPYFICPEGGARMGDISVFSHEFGHMLGLPDLYARPENPGSEGLGVWCLMSNQTPRGKPQHMSAWCKERLGWINPVVLDPSVPQGLLLAPIVEGPRECYKVLARPDGSEHFLLENRTAQGFDASLPAHGLLIWRVSDGRPTLEESHGVAGPRGPLVHLESVPWPSKAGRAFTPRTTPSSRSEKGGGLPVHLTGMRRLVDGRVAFRLGWEYE
ncbi:MAG: M6 family metalloprotease domain-containing protein [Gemmataceae bacterium]|nr:M6 family metalloprotease domain-containing protein [Gemmataceae bacterium]